MSDATIAPCPFCGGVDLGIGRGTEDCEGFPTYIYCVECGAQGPWFCTQDKLMWTCTAICAEKSGWNDRAAVGAGGSSRSAAGDE